MRRTFLFGLVATLVVVAAVGVALATTHGSPAVGSDQVAAPASGADSGAATPATFTEGEGGNADSWDDCGDLGESSRGAGAGAGHSSNSNVDDDGDGSGGDCGEGD